ncbi:MAG: single-stranded DNA-binding protein [Candidatus Dadabacteria bacterium]|nr:single-stranded DNA-binding protein [Candidatus Dadabacteria bacterium]
MRGVNKVTIIGNVGSDPEMKYTASGAAVANFSIATNESWTGKDGQKQERTEWHRIVAWSRLAEICGQYLAKGSPVYVEGSIRTRQWEDKEGNTRHTTEIHARDIQFLGSGGREGGGHEGGGGRRREDRSDAPVVDIPDNNMDDDIPF